MTTAAITGRLLVVTLIVLASSVCCADDIVPSKSLPETSPWDLHSLSAAPSVEWLDEESPVRSLLYDGEPFHGKPTRVFAYYATPGTLAGDPETDHELPAVVLVHGGGGTAFREWAEIWAKRGYSAIAMDLAGHRPIAGKDEHNPQNRERLGDGGPDQSDEEKFGSIAAAASDQWPYHAVANVIRAHSLVRSFPEVDKSRTAITGISWGGYLTCITASIDNRFRAAVPVYGCGYLHENSAWLDRLAKMSPEHREKWIQLWDPSRYLPAVSMPILFMNGTNDFAYPLDSYMKSYDAVPATKQLCVTVNMPHSHPDGWARREIGLFIDQHLLGQRALPTVGDPKLQGDMIHAATTSSGRIAEAALHVTSGTGPINQREWQSKPATIGENEVTTEAPGADATAWFLTVTDDRGAVVSSRIVFAEAK